MAEFWEQQLMDRLLSLCFKFRDKKEVRPRSPEDEKEIPYFPEGKSIPCDERYQGLPSLNKGSLRMTMSCPSICREIPYLFSFIVHRIAYFVLRGNRKMTQ